MHGRRRRSRLSPHPINGRAWMPCTAVRHPRRAGVGEAEPLAGRAGLVGSPACSACLELEPSEPARGAGHALRVGREADEPRHALALPLETKGDGQAAPGGPRRAPAAPRCGEAPGPDTPGRHAPSRRAPLRMKVRSLSADSCAQPWKPGTRSSLASIHPAQRVGGAGLKAHHAAAGEASSPRRACVPRTRSARARSGSRGCVSTSTQRSSHQSPPMTSVPTKRFRPGGPVAGREEGLTRPQPSSGARPPASASISTNATTSGRLAADAHPLHAFRSAAPPAPTTPRRPPGCPRSGSRTRPIPMAAQATRRARRPAMRCPPSTNTVWPYRAGGLCQAIAA